MEKVEIRSSLYPYDMSSWCIEKSCNVVNDLARVLEHLNNQQDISQEFKEELLSLLGSAIWDASKLLMFSCGSNWSTEDPHLIINEGYSGYEKVLVKYGLLDETTESKRNRKSLRFLTKFKECISGPMYPNRTLLHELLASCNINHPAIDSISESLDEVTMGELSWEDFVIYANFKFEHLVKELGVTISEQNTPTP